MKSVIERMQEEAVDMVMERLETLYENIHND